MLPLNQCQVKTTDSNIKVEEGKRKAVFRNVSRIEYLKTQVDGCLVKNQVASDWVVSLQNRGDVVIELKGTDTEHAAAQILATAKLWHEQSLRQGALAGLIVCAQRPRFDSKIRRAAQTLSNLYKAPLHVVTRNAEFDFEKVLAFDGPF